MSEKTPAERLIAFMHCVQQRGHDFSISDTCSRCQAHKGDATMLDLLRHARVKKENPYAQ
jgi:hypothetical protein